MIKLSVDNWYISYSYELDTIEAGSFVLLNSRVDQLVNAMASYYASIGAGNIVAQDTENVLQTLLTETWEAN